jgi:hypothetical protein
MSCCPGPEHGKPFDPDAELPCEADMARFGDEEDESTDLFDDELGAGYGRSPNEAVPWDSPKKGGFVLVAKVLVATMILLGCAGVIWFAR